uniref:FHA domain-containing protein n=1 Tax=Shewanella eurypsychrophilus TaxID=2593656 RepID=A0A7S9P075_9GAMM
MFNVVVSTTKGTKVGEFQCIHSHCKIGKDPEQLIVLRGFKVSKHHAVLTQNDKGIFIQDNKSRTGLKVNDEKTAQFGPLTLTDMIQVGDYQIRVHSTDPEFSAQPVTQEPITDSLKTESITDTSQESAEPLKENSKKTQSTIPLQSAAQLESIKVRNDWRRKVHSELLKQMDLRRVNVNEMSDVELRSQSESLINQIISTIGLGPLEGLLADIEVTEIMVNSHDQIFYEKAGKLYLSDIAFSDDQAVLGAIERIVTPIGRRIDESSPMVDARLKDGSQSMPLFLHSVTTKFSMRKQASFTFPILPSQMTKRY